MRSKVSSTKEFIIDIAFEEIPMPGCTWRGSPSISSSSPFPCLAPSPWTPPSRLCLALLRNPYHPPPLSEAKHRATPLNHSSSLKQLTPPLVHAHQPITMTTTASAGFSLVWVLHWQNREYQRALVRRGRYNQSGARKITPYWRHQLTIQSIFQVARKELLSLTSSIHSSFASRRLYCRHWCLNAGWCRVW